MSRVLSLELREETYADLAAVATRLGRTAEDTAKEWIEGKAEEARMANLLGHVGTDPRVVMKLPLEDRRRILAAQADKLVAHYESDTEWREWDAANLIDG